MPALSVPEVIFLSVPESVFPVSAACEAAGEVFAPIPKGSASGTVLPPALPEEGRASRPFPRGFPPASPSIPYFPSPEISGVDWSGVEK